jgi:hypothetical protein
MATALDKLPVSSLFALITAAMCPDVSAAAPELFIESQRMMPRYVRAGGERSFTARVKNQGDAAAAASDVRLRIDETNDGTWEHSITQPLAAMSPGDEITLRWPDAWTGSPGPHRYEICADPGGTTGDGDVSNNCVYQDVVGEPAVATDGDLYVFSMKVAPAAPRMNRNVSFVALISNHGTVGVGHVEFPLEVDGAHEATGVVRIRSGARTRAAHVKTWEPVPGVHTYRLCAEDTVVPDPSLDDNCVEGTFVVGNAP